MVNRLKAFEEEQAQKVLPQTAAERLIQLARVVREPAGKLILVEAPAGLTVDESLLSLLRTAVEFDKRPREFVIQAIIESWDLVRIIREMY